MLGDRVRVIPLRDVDQEEATALEHANIFLQEGFGLWMVEMLQEPLVKYNVKGLVPKRKLKRISAHDIGLNVKFFRQAFQDLQRIHGVVELDDLCPVFDERETISSGSCSDLEDTFSTKIAYPQKLPQDSVFV
jgi:hypothetical protein